jgi:DNA-binding GntR family transcriptional regulator
MESLVSPRTLVEQAYDVILDAICDGTLRPGERLTQADVADRLNVSRQPINNALLVLKAQGFVRETGRRGLAVAPLDPKLFEAIYQFRSAIEPLAMRLAAPHMSEEALQRGQALLERGETLLRTGDGKALVQADMDFHSFFYELSGNALIVDTMRLNWQHLRRSMGEVLRLPDYAARAWREHATILEAMRRGEAETAARLACDHVVSAYERVKPTLGCEFSAAES